MTDEERKKIIAYQQCFGTEAGKFVLADLKKNCFAVTSAFAMDPYLTAYRNGYRDILIYVERQINKDTKKPEPEKPVDDKYI